MKNILTSFVLLFLMGTNVFFGQQKVKTNNALVKFDAAKSNLEPIKAENNKVKLILDTSNGQLACLMNITDFVFKNKLMQEHFNENYLESDKYPKATFIGNIENFDKTNFTEKSEIKVNGTFNIHGVQKKKNILLNIVRKHDKYIFSGDFNIDLKDFNIKIPTIMFYKITENIKVSIEAELNK
ncbi:YceI family protein [Wenyingzhuangia sp. IMCC45533]